MTKRKIGAFICGCGGNISDFVDVEKVRAEIEKEPFVEVAQTAMFTCSDATQQEIIDIVKEKDLDGIVVASCSPKLHQNTFRAMATRAGLNQYVYNQVNIREQCSWAHPRDLPGATDKAIRLIRAGVAKTIQGRPLDMIRIKTIPRVLVVGGGVAGLQAARMLAGLNVEVHIVESAAAVGGQVASWGPLFPSGRSGTELVEALHEKVRANNHVHLHLSSRVVEKSGTVGDFQVTVANADDGRFALNVGAIIVATGFQRYQPGVGEFGFGLPGVVTLDQFRELLQEASEGQLRHNGRSVRDVAYIYCVGSRNNLEDQHAHAYCSRYCCTAAVHTALLAGELQNPPRQFHLYRDMRTYGRQELIYDQALHDGSLFFKFAAEESPIVSAVDGRLQVTIKDQLTGGEEITVPADMVVLVTGMEPRPNQDLTDVLKLPVGKDGFYNEVHPKLRPVETALDGILLAGTAQGPKNVPESMTSAMSAVTKSAGLLLKGFVDLEPFVASVDSELCTWCEECAAACPYDAISMAETATKAVATVNTALCKGCGACVPACELEAISVEGYSHRQITGMIDALVKEMV